MERNADSNRIEKCRLSPSPRKKMHKKLFSVNCLICITALLVQKKDNHENCSVLFLYFQISSFIICSQISTRPQCVNFYQHLEVSPRQFIVWRAEKKTVVLNGSTASFRSNRNVINFYSLARLMFDFFFWTYGWMVIVSCMAIKIFLTACAERLVSYSESVALSLE